MFLIEHLKSYPRIRVRPESYQLFFFKLVLLCFPTWSLSLCAFTFPLISPALEDSGTSPPLEIRGFLEICLLNRLFLS